MQQASHTNKTCCLMRLMGTELRHVSSECQLKMYLIFNFYNYSPNTVFFARMAWGEGSGQSEKNFTLPPESLGREQLCAKPLAPTDLVRPTIKFGHLDTQGKAVTLGNGTSHLCASTYVCVHTPLATNPTATSVSFN